MSEKKIEIAKAIKAIDDGAEVQEQACLCFACKHSMIFRRSIPRPNMNQLTRRMEQKLELRDQATCCRWNSPMLIGTDVNIEACTEFEYGPIKEMRTAGDEGPSILTQ